MSQMVIHQRSDHALLGILLILAANLFFSFIDTGAKWLAVASIPALQLAFMRYIGHFVISTSLIGSGGFHLERFVTPHLPLVILRAVMLMLATILNFWAVRYLPLTLTSTILFSSPIIICLLSWPLLGERVGPIRWVAILIGFAGVVIAIRPFDESFHWAMIISLIGAVCFALYSLLTRQLAGKASVDVMQFYTGAIGSLCLLPVAIWQWQSPETISDWLIMISLGIFGWAGHQLLTRAHGFAPASTLMPFGYSFILYLSVWSYVIFAYLPDKWNLIGGALIVISGILIWMRELQRSAPQA